MSKRIAVLGLGKMGRILAESLLRSGASSRELLSGTVHHSDKAAELAAKLELNVGTDNQAAVRSADIVLLCVKPQNVADVLGQIKQDLGGKLVISIAASVPTAYIEERIHDGVAVIRAMPNMPAMVGRGVTAICGGRHAQASDLSTAQELFGYVGEVVRVDEEQMNAVTGLSASGPAYVYIILESLAEAGVKLGLPREVATRLAIHTVLGASQVALETGVHPALLKDAVTTPAGCTIDGVLELEEGRFRVTLIRAVVKAANRAKELWVR